MGIVSTVVEYSGIDPEKAIRKGSMDIDAGFTQKHANYTVENMHWQNDTTVRLFIICTNTRRKEFYVAHIQLCTRNSKSYVSPTQTQRTSKIFKIMV